MCDLSLHWYILPYTRNFFLPNSSLPLSALIPPTRNAYRLLTLLDSSVLSSVRLLIPVSTLLSASLPGSLLVSTICLRIFADKGQRTDLVRDRRECRRIGERQRTIERSPIDGSISHGLMLLQLRAFRNAAVSHFTALCHMSGKIAEWGEFAQAPHQRGGGCGVECIKEWYSSRTILAVLKRAE